MQSCPLSAQLRLMQFDMVKAPSFTRGEVQVLELKPVFVGSLNPGRVFKPNAVMPTQLHCHALHQFCVPKASVCQECDVDSNGEVVSGFRERLSIVANSNSGTLMIQGAVSEQQGPAPMHHRLHSRRDLHQRRQTASGNQDRIYRDVHHASLQVIGTELSSIQQRDTAS